MTFSDFLNESNRRAQTSKERRGERLDRLPKGDSLKNNSNEIFKIIEQILNKSKISFKYTFTKPRFSEKVPLGVSEFMRFSIKPQVEGTNEVERAVRDMWEELKSEKFNEKIIKLFKNKEYYKDCKKLTCEFNSLDTFGKTFQRELDLEIEIYSS